MNHKRVLGMIEQYVSHMTKIGRPVEVVHITAAQKASVESWRKKNGNKEPFTSHVGVKIEIAEQ